MFLFLFLFVPTFKVIVIVRHKESRVGHKLCFYCSYTIGPNQASFIRCLTYLVIFICIMYTLHAMYTHNSRPTSSIIYCMALIIQYIVFFMLNTCLLQHDYKYTLFNELFVFVVAGVVKVCRPYMFLSGFLRYRNRGWTMKFIYEFVLRVYYESLITLQYYCL